jgi:hypothetical protein
MARAARKTAKSSRVFKVSIGCSVSDNLRIWDAQGFYGTGI